jgi:hypothetical protein
MLAFGGHPREWTMPNTARREDQLRRTCKKLGYILRKARGKGAGTEHGPYHVIEPMKNLEISGTRYPNGMTLKEAESFVETRKE